jgi:uncharacterized membrane protein YcaP (DUF421 family)
MEQSLFHMSMPAIEFVIRAASVYVFILLALRLAGKRQMAQMSPTEFVAILLVSNAVQNSMNGGDNSLLGGFILATVLVVSSTLISYLTFRSRRLRKIFEGNPTLLIHNGSRLEAHLRHERITHSELKSMLRRQGIHDLKEVHEAVLEPDGNFSVTKKSDLVSSQI